MLVLMDSCGGRWRLTAQQVVQRAQPLSERFDVFGGAEPAGDEIAEEAVVFAHRLQEEEEEEETVCCHGNVFVLM